MEAEEEEEGEEEGEESRARLLCAMAELYHWLSSAELSPAAGGCRADAADAQAAEE
jgi:hypothetical protein